MKLISIYLIKIICFFIFLFALSGCITKNSAEELSNLDSSNQMYNINIDLSNGKEVVKYSTFFKNLKIIKLENNNNAIIGNIDKMQRYKNLIVIMDGHKSKGVFIFSIEGQFIRKIGGIGNGPEEYSNPEDFTIDDINGLIYILDSEAKKINKYNLIDGKYLASISLKTNSSVNCIQFVKNKLYADAYFYESSKENYILQEIDLQTGEQKSHWLNSKDNCNWDNLSIIQKHVFYIMENKSAIFLQNFMPSIIAITEQGVSRYISIRSDLLIKSKDIASLDRKSKVNILVQLLKKGKVSTVQNYIEHNDYIFFNYMHGFTLKYLFYNKKTNETITTNGIINDVLFTNEDYDNIISKFEYADSTGVYMCTDDWTIENLINIVNNEEALKSTTKFNELKDVTIDSNPIIFYYEYKE